MTIVEQKFGKTFLYFLVSDIVSPFEESSMAMKKM
jgi:hypothetical protein